MCSSDFGSVSSPTFCKAKNPDGLASHYYLAANKMNAAVVSLQIVIDAAKLLGLSTS
jgi:hypothetical protein